MLLLGYEGKYGRVPKVQRDRADLLGLEGSAIFEYVCSTGVFDGYNYSELHHKDSFPKAESLREILVHRPAEKRNSF